MWLWCRVFISGQITTNATTTGTSAQQRQMQRASLAPTHVSSLSSVAATAAATHARPAPLFLRHVVNRRFKYRWLVLALSGFTCMSIIVILSVVYSNWSPAVHAVSKIACNFYVDFQCQCLTNNNNNLPKLYDEFKGAPRQNFGWAKSPLHLLFPSLPLTFPSPPHFSAEIRSAVFWSCKM